MSPPQLIEETLGYTPKELIGLSSHDVFVPTNRAMHVECEKQNPVPETEQSGELEIKTKSGEARWIALKTTPFRNSEGQVRPPIPLTPEIFRFTRNYSATKG